MNRADVAFLGRADARGFHDDFIYEVDGRAYLHCYVVVVDLVLDCIFPFVLFSLVKIFPFVFISSPHFIY